MVLPDADVEPAATAVAAGGYIITAAEAERVEHSIRHAVDGGAKLLTGGERDGAVREIEAGNVHINWTAVASRPDALRRAEGERHRQGGPRSAVAEMTDVKTVILHGRPW